MIKVFVKNDSDKRTWLEIGTFDSNKARIAVVQETNRALSPNEWNQSISLLKGKKSVMPRLGVKIQLA